MLAAFIAGRLVTEDRRALIAHAEVCGTCREQVVTTIDATTFRNPVLRVRGERLFGARSVVIFVLAAAALLTAWYRVPLQRRLFSQSDMDDIVAAGALLERRPSVARLSADFPYRDASTATQARSIEARPPAALTEVIERLQKEAGAGTTRRRHALGVAYLLAGKSKLAVETLEDAVQNDTGGRHEIMEAISHSSDAALLNDLAAAYLVFTERQDGLETQPLALQAVERAWSLQKTPQIAWSRAVVIASFHVRQPSIAAWREYLALEPSSEWSNAARRSLEQLLQQTDAELWPSIRNAHAAYEDGDSRISRDVARFRQEVRLWCEDELLPAWGAALLNGDPSAPARLAQIGALAQALEQNGGERDVADTVEALRKASPANLRRLAEGHVAYGASRLADRNSRVADSIREMDAAVATLVPELTPFAWRVRIEHAGMVYMSNDYAATRAELQKIQLAQPALSNSCRGFLHALLGIVDLQTASYDQSARHFMGAVEAYRRAGERGHEAKLMSRLAEALDWAGDSVRAQSYRRRALQLLERTGDPRHIHDTLYGGALAAMAQDQHAVAKFFLDALVAHNTGIGNWVTTCTSLMWRSAYRYRRGLLDAGRADLDDAGRVCNTIPEGPVRERALANLELAKSALGADESSTGPLSGLEDAIRYYQRTGSRVWLRTAYFARARRLEKRGDVAGAERDFISALHEGDESRTKIDQRRLRMSFTATADEIEDGYVEFLLRQHRGQDAFEIADRRRLRELVDSPTARWSRPGAGASLHEIQIALPFDAVLIEYRVLRTSIVAWVITPTAFHVMRLPHSIHDIKAAIRALEADSPGADPRTNAALLYDALVRSAESWWKDSRHLVIVPDDDLERVPYSGLYDRLQQRWLLETHATVVAPSALLFAQSSARWKERSRRTDRTVIIQAAAGGEDAAALPQAAKEAQGIARLYREARIIDATSATAGTLLNEISEASVLQFVGHTAADGDPASRALRLGGSPQSRLGMADILEQPLPKLRLAYLSACETDRGPILKSEGSMTMARAFFAAGVPAVVGTLWPVKDDAARLAAQQFHEHLLRGKTPAEALREAQLSVATRGWGFREWATLRLIGAGIE